MARRKITGQLKTFLEALYNECAGSAVKAAVIAGYPNPIIDGPRVRRKYPDLCERARLAWIETAHVGYDEALALLGGVARNPAAREQVRALSTILDLHGARNSQDPAVLRKDLSELLRQLGLQRAVLQKSLPAAEQEIIEVEPQPAALQD